MASSRCVTADCNCNCDCNETTAPPQLDSSLTCTPVTPQIPQQTQSDPRGNNWRDVIKPLPGAAALPTGADASGLSEVLNVAWAGHELVSEPVGEALTWLHDVRSSGGRGHGGF
jgi:hypothetical protein